LALAASRGGLCRLDPSIHLGQRQKKAVRDGAAAVDVFLSELATRVKVAAAAQNQALAALIFLYREVFGQRLPWLDKMCQAKRPERAPTVLTRAEEARVLSRTSDVTCLLASLLYGASLRLMKCLRPRVRTSIPRGARS
jgi:hypothetical protein